jgi:hypothetical protein
MASTSKGARGPNACHGAWSRWGGLPLALLAAGCGGGEDRPPPLGSIRPVRGCEAFSYRTCDILTDACQREIFGLMACLYGDDEAGDPPPVRLLDEASAIALIADSAEGMAMTEGLDAMQSAAQDERAFRAGVRGLELLGMLSPGLIEDESDVLDVTTSAALAFYLPTTKEIVIIDRGEPVADLDANAVLGHELVHALQDRRHDLGSFDAADAVADSDRVLAVSSLIEGEATLYQYLFAYAYQGANLDRLNFDAFFSQLASFGSELTREQGSPAVTANSIFPYTYGTRYAGERWRSAGSAGVDAAYEHPPVTTLEVLRGGAVDPGELTLFDQPPAPLDGYEAVVDDAVGAWVTVAVLTGVGPGSERLSLEDLASHWRGDRYWVYETVDEQGSVAALWAIDWDTPDAAAQFESVAAALAPEGALLHIDTSGASTRVTAVERTEDLETWRTRLMEAANSRPAP